MVHSFILFCCCCNRIHSFLSCSYFILFSLFSFHWYNFFRVAKQKWKKRQSRSQTKTKTKREIVDSIWHIHIWCDGNVVLRPQFFFFKFRQIPFYFSRMVVILFLPGFTHYIAILWIVIILWFSIAIYILQ